MCMYVFSSIFVHDPPLSCEEWGDSGVGPFPGAGSFVFRAVLPVSLGGPKCVKIGCLRDALSVGVRRADPVPSPGMLFLAWVTLPLTSGFTRRC